MLQSLSIYVCVSVCVCTCAQRQGKASEAPSLLLGVVVVRTSIARAYPPFSLNHWNHPHQVPTEQEQLRARQVRSISKPPPTSCMYVCTSSSLPDPLPFSLPPTPLDRRRRRRPRDRSPRRRSPSWRSCGRSSPTPRSRVRRTRSKSQSVGRRTAYCCSCSSQSVAALHIAVAAAVSQSPHELI